MRHDKIHLEANILKNTNAIIYTSAPTHRTNLNPVAIANIIVSIGARTEKQPFIAHAHGINVLFLSDKTVRPKGKGMPMRRPSGVRTKNTKIILINIE